MKNHLLLLCLFALGLTGCMEIDIKIKQNKDGSGRSTIHLEMLDQMYGTVMQLAESRGEAAELFDRDALEAYLKENGGQLHRFENKAVDGIRIIEVETSLKDAGTFYETKTQGLLGLKKDGDAWKWTFLDNDMTAAFTELEDSVLEQQLNMMKAGMAGLVINLEVEVPELVETNLDKVNSTTARFKLDFDEEIGIKSGLEAVEAFRQMLAPKWVTFKGMKAE